jgi:hypothetical protein
MPQLIAINAGIRKLARNGRGCKLPIPRLVLEMLNWPIGTPIYIQVNPDNTVTLGRVNLPAIHPTPLQDLPCEENPSPSTRSPDPATLIASPSTIRGNTSSSKASDNRD